MVEQTKPEGISQRFGGYIDILREFLTSRDVPFGAARDVLLFAQRVAEPGAFQEEMASMVRTVMYQEDERLGRGELLQLLIVTVGGNEAEGPERPELQPAVRQIFTFINATLRQGRMSFADTSPQAEEPGDFPARKEFVAAPAPEAPPQPRSQPEIEPKTQPLPSVRASAAPATPSRAAAPAGEQDPVEASRQRPLAPAPKPASARPEMGSEPPARAVPRRPAPLPEVTPVEDTPKPRAKGEARSEVLSRAMALSADQELYQQPSATDLPSDSARNRWLVPAVAAVLSVVGIGAYLARPYLRGHTAPSQVASSTTEAADIATIGGSCVAPMVPGASRASLDERARWAHSLLNQKLYASALPELREIARMDPGYPGIKLDESEALLRLKRPEDALEAVDSQINTSECLSRLPEEALQNYCATQLPVSNLAACRPQLAHVRQAAELQAALVHLELGHQVMPSGTASTAMAELNDATRQGGKSRRTHTPVVRESDPEPLPPATEGDAEQPALPRAAARGEGRRPADDLRHGDGTDSAYGAYQKPQ